MVCQRWQDSAWAARLATGVDRARPSGASRVARFWGPEAEALRSCGPCLAGAWLHLWPSARPERRRWAGGGAGDGNEGSCTISVVKSPGDRLGLGIGRSGGGGAVVVGVKPGGLLEEHNLHADRDRALFAGCVIQSVNQLSCYWRIFEELTKPEGPFEIRFTQKPPPGSSQNWFEEIERFGKSMEAGGSSVVLRLNEQEGRATPASTSPYCGFTSVRADDAGVDQCSICLEDVPGNVRLMQLPCGHCFHVHCAGRWLTQGNEKHRCPLCCQSVGDTCGRCRTRAASPARDCATERPADNADESLSI